MEIQPIEKLARLSDPVAAGPLTGSCLASLVEVRPDGWLVVRTADSCQFACLWLDGLGLQTRPLQPGDQVLTLRPDTDRPGIVLGRVRAYIAEASTPTLNLEATESLTLKCGEASVELRADGRAMVKGEDVLLRAKGTQRIRAGNVAIN
ncbi:conserved hypothetical protein [Rubrivivax sp. A210]|uniref:hypothetical protein n=1 Tax=Rubrivivax sp. A210 TaxID=2772301 RepID=UPI00191AF246|nr:hypothetical protein [Rubrivivax sp. A210]CAD5373637.1 conserved hypothetical protein [Rubrivivax sp. A210]